jgi:hypothetical protein
LYADAFATKPPLAEDPRTGYRYYAACAAASAGCGQGGDAAGLDDAERARWRGQALEWLRADLTAWLRWRDGAPAARRGAVLQALTRWREYPDLAYVRDPDDLARLAPDDRAGFLALWADVAAALTRSEP